MVASFFKKGRVVCDNRKKQTNKQTKQKLFLRSYFSNNSDPEMEVRLTGPNRDTVQIKYNDDWMSICDENWNMYDAEVVCRQLGYSRAEAAPKTGYHGWQGYYLRNFLCKGNETRLDQCKGRADWALQKCASDRFAGVRCVGDQNTTVHVTHRVSGGGTRSQATHGTLSTYL